MLKNKSVLVLGLGISGLAAVEYLLKEGATVTAYDDKAIPQGLQKFEGDFSSIDLVVVSPGIPRTHPLYVESVKRGIEVIGEVELASRFLKMPVIAVTGTNGKTTVCLLIEHILKQAGKKVKLLGNSGIPITSQSHEKELEIVVLELSSFQLETLKSPFIDLACVLNITPDHLDRYADMQEYAKTKLDIARNLKKEGKLFLEHETYQQYGQLISRPCKTYGFYEQDHLFNDFTYLYKEGQKTALPNEFRHQKTHDVENFMAAFAICREMNIAEEQILKAFETFKKPHHRIEFVTEISGVSYYDDSKGTNIDAVIRCIQSLRGPIILIAGGVDKGASYTYWIKPFQDKVKMILTIGQAAAKIEDELKSHFPIRRCLDLAEAIEWGEKHSEPGDNIVLSPGCSSYDMFKDYAHRGDEFKRLVLRRRG